MAEREAPDYTFVDFVDVCGDAQGWRCVACGLCLAPTTEASLYVVRPTDGRKTMVVVHTDCRQALLDAGTWTAWRKRAARHPETFKLAEAQAALKAAAGPAGKAPDPAEDPPEVELA